MLESDEVHVWRVHLDLNTSCLPNLRQILGEGLSLPLDQFDVSLAPGDPATLWNIRGDPLEASRWSLQELIPGPGYVAALAVEGHGWRLACWEWRE